MVFDDFQFRRKLQTHRLIKLVLAPDVFNAILRAYPSTERTSVMPAFLGELRIEKNHLLPPQTILPIFGERLPSKADIIRQFETLGLLINSEDLNSDPPKT